MPAAKSKSKILLHLELQQFCGRGSTDTVVDVQSWHAGRLSTEQSAYVGRWLHNPRPLEDMSWDLIDTVVLDVQSERGRFVIKAGGPTNNHIAREITAHETVTTCLVRTGHAAQMVEHDRAANLLVTQYLPGSLVMGGAKELDADIYRQAGTLLRTFHDQSERLDPNWDSAAVTKSLRRLERPNRISQDIFSNLREILATYRPKPVVVVPTHGDWQPRNWLVDHGEVRAIDFGRFDWRPAMTDFCRLAAKEWQGNSELEDAFLAGYGREPRDPEQWRMSALHEAIGTAVWAYQVGDERVESQGHVMIDTALQLF